MSPSFLPSHSPSHTAIPPNLLPSHTAILHKSSVTLSRPGTVVPQQMEVSHAWVHARAISHGSYTHALGSCMRMYMHVQGVSPPQLLQFQKMGVRELGPILSPSKMHTTSRAVSVLDRNYKVGIRTCLLELLAALLFERYAAPPPNGRLLDLPVTLQSKRNSGKLVREVGRYVAGEGCAGESDWLGFTQTDSTHTCA